MGDLGLCMNLNRVALMEAISKASTPDCFNYVEIGVYNGDTMKAVCDHLKATRPEWRAFGVERPGWSKTGHRPVTSRCLGNYWKGCGTLRGDHPVNSAMVYSVGSGAFLKDSGVVPHFVFIDGCHSVKCCKLDFVMTEVIMPPGGVVAIHDIDLSYQGLDPGDHCPGEGIGVIKACEDLKLLPLPVRSGWNEIGRTPEGFENHGCLFLQKL